MIKKKFLIVQKITKWESQKQIVKEKQEKEDTEKIRQKKNKAK